MAFTARQKMILWVDDDGQMRGGWITVHTLNDLRAEGMILDQPINATQAATVIDAISKRLEEG